MGRWLAVVTVALVIVVAKPWSSPEASSAATAGSAGAVGAPRNPTSAAATATPATAHYGAGPAVAAFCLDTGSWLVASVERWHDQRIRVWQALEPAIAATGPDDPGIPITPVTSDGVTELGWCAPVVGVERPAGPVEISVWRRSPGGVVPMVVDTSLPSSDRSAFGQLYRPPGPGPSSRANSWMSGTYVFRHRGADGRQRWFAVEVEIRPRPAATP